MGKDNEKKKSTRRFKTGRFGGCEAVLYEFRERAEKVSDSADSKTLDHLKPYSVRIAARTFDEALEYLRSDQPHFVVDSMQNLGLIILASGSPLD